MLKRSHHQHENIIVNRITSSVQVILKFGPSNSPILNLENGPGSWNHKSKSSVPSELSDEARYAYTWRRVNTVVMTERTALLASDHSLEAARAVGGAHVLLGRVAVPACASLTHAGGATPATDPHHVLVVGRRCTVRPPDLRPCPLHQHVVSCLTFRYL